MKADESTPLLAVGKYNTPEQGSINTPEGNINTPEVSINSPEVSINSPEVSINSPEGNVNTLEGSVNTSEGSIITPEIISWWKTICPAIAAFVLSVITIPPTHKKKLCFFVIGMLVLCQFIRVVLWVSTYALFNTIPCNNNSVMYFAYKEPIEPGSFVHVILCLQVALLGLLSCLEYIQLWYGYFVSPDNMIYDLSVRLKKLAWKKEERKANFKFFCCGMFSWFCSFLIITLILLSLGMSKMVSAIAMEEHCSHDVRTANFYLFIVFDFLDVCFSVITRLYMLRMLYRMSKVWWYEGGASWFEKNTSTHQQEEQPDEQGSESQQQARNKFRAEFLEYHKKGQAAVNLMSPFVGWFLTPWIYFLVLSSIDPHLLLSFWADENFNLPEVSRVYYLFKIAFRSSLLLLQYAFALKISQYHKDYYMAMKRRILAVDKSRTLEYLVEAQQLVMDQEEDYNFYPKFLSINPRISVEGPFYIMFFLLGVVISASDKLLYNKDIVPSSLIQSSS